MITAREIRGYLQEARERTRGLYWMSIKPSLRNDCSPIRRRICDARTNNGAVQVRALTNGEWYTVTDGDAFYID